MSGEGRFEQIDGGIRFTAPLIDDATSKMLRVLAQQKDAAIKAELIKMGWIAPEDVDAYNAEVAAQAVTTERAKAVKFLRGKLPDTLTMSDGDYSTTYSIGGILRALEAGAHDGGANNG